MNKIIFSVLALALPAVGAFAIIPVEEAPAQAVKNAKLQRSAIARVAADNRNTFYEGFEERPDGYGNYYDEWLPEGWQDVSKSGQTVPGAGEYRHNLTWRVLNNENRANAPTVQCYAYDGEAFAFIMADVAYEDHVDLAEQDEWLIMPDVTPVEEDWLYFKLFFRPSWTVFNSKADTFDARNNQLEVLVSEDGGTNWTKLWNVIDDEISKYTEEYLREELLQYNRTDYTPIYINLEDYVGKSIKIAFRYFGNYGHPMALDDVAVGVPMPKASYEIPAGFLKQGISCKVDYPADPVLLIPYDYEAVWRNTSEDILRSEWTYADATGAIVKSDEEDLTTPAYTALKTYDTPILTGFFESRESEPFQVGYSKMLAGGVITGKDASGYEGEFGVGYYDITDTEHKIVVSSEYIGFNPEIDLAWEKILGQLDGAIDVLGYGCVYPSPEVPYGFDYVDVAVFVKETLDEETELLMSVFSLDEEGLPDLLIGQATLAGADIPAQSDEYVNLHFEFPVPVNVSKDILVLMSGFSRESGNVVFPYVKTTSSNVGNSVVYMDVYDATVGEYDTFYNLNNFPLSDGYHFAGLLMTLGASYSWMELAGDATMDVAFDGGTKDFTVKAYHAPERWALSTDGVTVADWVSQTSVYDEASGSYKMTLKVETNPLGAAREADVIVASPGSSFTVHVKQDGNPDGVDDVFAAAAVKVSVCDGDIVVEGSDGYAEVYNVAGVLVASARLNGRTAIPAAHLSSGVYVVRVDGEVAGKVVK